MTALGLLGYAVWRVVQAFMDAEDKGTDAKGIIARVGFFINGITYTGLALVAGQIAIGAGTGGGDNSKREWTLMLLSQPFGQWLVGIIGAFLLVAAVQVDPSEARDLSDAMNTLAQQPYGIWIYGVVALGLVAYGVYCISRARYRGFSMY